MTLDVNIRPAWTAAEIRGAVEEILVAREGLLPPRRDARIVIKPNLNNDLVALAGNSTDLRVLAALVEGLRRRGYTDLTVADGANVGVHRRGISAFHRLRVDAFCDRFRVRLVDLNADEGTEVPLAAGARPRVARTILETDFLISVPKVKTHAEMVLSSALKNWVGITVGQDKRHVHYDLARNIVLLNRHVRPDLVIVDGLVGMEGNGPGDGDPFRLGLLVDATDAFLSDLVVARLVGLPARAVPCLGIALEDGDLADARIAEVEGAVAVRHVIRRPPPRSPLARLSEARALLRLKRAVRPLVDRPAVADLAYRARVVQDVYDRRDDTLRLAGRDRDRCTDCGRCADFCPVALPAGEIGTRTEPEACLHCLYCWLACPHDALRVEGEPRGMARQLARYRGPISRL